MHNHLYCSVSAIFSSVLIPVLSFYKMSLVHLVLESQAVLKEVVGACQKDMEISLKWLPSAKSGIIQASK